MMEDYARQRREYISQVRNSFDTEEIPETPVEYGHETRWMRLRFVAAILLFAAFFYWHSTGIQIQDVQSTKIIDMVEDNRYDKLLQEYLEKGSIQ